MKYLLYFDKITTYIKKFQIYIFLIFENLKNKIKNLEFLLSK